MSRILEALDPGIAPVVRHMREHGLDTFASCQGGPGHASLYPEVLFYGDEHAGLWAVWILEDARLHVSWLSRMWDLDHGSPRRPYWQVVLREVRIPSD